MRDFTLLCAEDDLSTQLILKKILSSYFKKIIFAKNGKEALELFKDNKIDIVITDYKMPKINGIKLIKKIRKKDKNIPIILASAFDDLEMFEKAIELNVNFFVKKPFDKEKLKEIIDKSIKLKEFNNFLEIQKKIKEKKIKFLEENLQYKNYQEKLAFEKELNIITNDFYYKSFNSNLLEVLYHPLDIISGDSYSIRKLDNKIFAFIVDGMGKGLSASLTAMILTSYVNDLVDNDFSYEEIIRKSLNYIRKIMLSNESVSVGFLLLDEDKLFYSLYGMPAILVDDSKITSNNPPFNKNMVEFNIDEINLKNVKKLLFYSDGLIENSTSDGRIYYKYLKEDFQNAFIKNDLKEMFLSRVNQQEDDVTFIFINRIKNFEPIYKITKTFKTEYSCIDDSLNWIEKEISKFIKNEKEKEEFLFVFQELFMNAYEHGNLGISFEKKAELMKKGDYLDYIKFHRVDLVINVELKVFEFNNRFYIYVVIEDNGNGFNTDVILKELYKTRSLYNGRGISMSLKFVDDIFYNEKGNRVSFIKRINK